MGAPSFLFALANLVVVAVKLFKPNKMPSMIGCGLCFLGMIFTLASCLLRDVRRREEDISKALDAGSSYGLGFGSSVTCAAFRLPAHRSRPGWVSSVLPLSVISLLPGMATTNVAAVGSDRSLPTKGVRDTTPALQGLRCDSMAVRAGAHAQGARS